jgi:voltage-gated potassium channel
MLAVILAVLAFIRAISFSLKDEKFRGVLIFGIGLIVSGAVFYHRIEGWSYLDSFYFCVVTLATVGYGDFTPKTAEGKVFTIFYIIFGIGAFLAFVNTIITSTQEKRIEKRTKKTSAKNEKTDNRNRKRNTKKKAA